MNLIKKSLAVTLLATLTTTAWAINSQVNTENDNVISFNTQVSQSVDHNLWEAKLFIQEDNKDLQTATTAVNKNLDKALEIIKKNNEIEIKSTTINTRVRYNEDNQQEGWIVNGEIVLKSKNNIALSKVLNSLNGIVAIESINSEVSDAALAALEDSMTEKALKQFEHKAKVIQNTMHAKNYKIISLNLSTPMDRYRPYQLMRMASESPAAENSTTVLGQQKTTINARVDAKIQLINE